MYATLHDQHNGIVTIELCNKCRKNTHPGISYNQNNHASETWYNEYQFFDLNNKINIQNNLIEKQQDTIEKMSTMVNKLSEQLEIKNKMQ